MRLCSVTDCHTIHYGRGFCQKHYDRWKRLGTTSLPSYPRGTPDERFWIQVIEQDDCWIWTGAKDGKGYGLFKFDGMRVRAHRYAYETMICEIPIDLQSDHLCRNKGCVNPYHIEPVTAQVNSRRRSAALPQQAECKYGHKYTPENTGGTKGKRYCRICSRSRKRRYRREQKAMTLSCSEVV